MLIWRILKQKRNIILFNAGISFAGIKSFTIPAFLPFREGAERLQHGGKNEVRVGRTDATPRTLPDATAGDRTLHDHILNRLCHGTIWDAGALCGRLHGGHGVSLHVAKNGFKGGIGNDGKGLVHLTLRVGGELSPTKTS